MLLLQTVNEETCASLWWQWNPYPCFCDWVFKSLLCLECFFMTGRLPITQPSTLHVRQEVNLTIHMQWRVPSTCVHCTKQWFCCPFWSSGLWLGMGCMHSMVMQLEICLAPWKKGDWGFISQSYLSSHLWCQALMQARSLNCFTPKSLFLKAHISAAQTSPLVLNWVVAKCVCELLHKVQWSLSEPQISFFRVTSAMAIPVPYANWFFPFFLPRRQIKGMSPIFPQTVS